MVELGLIFNRFPTEKTMEERQQDITAILREWSDGKNEALDRLIPLVYNELHRQAASYLRRERADHTLQATALINEAYLKLVDQTLPVFEDRTHFFAISARLMRQILVDHARSHQRQKRGGPSMARIELDEAAGVDAGGANIDLVALDDALEHLAKLDKRQTQIVELRYFSGMSLEETADALRISRATAARDWNVAKAWLKRELTR